MKTAASIIIIIVSICLAVLITVLSFNQPTAWPGEYSCDCEDVKEMQTFLKRIQPEENIDQIIFHLRNKRDIEVFSNIKDTNSIILLPSGAWIMPRKEPKRIRLYCRRF